jgi:dihydrofolate reductase
MKLTVHTFTSMDGVMQGLGGPDEDRSGGFPHGGWMAAYVDDGMGQIVDGWFARAEAFLLGRSTYEMMCPYWSQVTDPDDTVGRKLNAAPKYVASRTLSKVDWHHASLLSADLEGDIRALKEQQGGELQLHGSWQLVQSLHGLGLIDEYRVLAFPVALGQGKRLFHDGTSPNGFELVETSTTDAGAVSIMLRPAGPLRQGEFVVEDGTEATLLV